MNMRTDALHPFQRLIRHFWTDERDAARWVPNDMALRLAGRVTASELRHSGEIRICVEGSLPLHEVWSCRDRQALKDAVRFRALHWFGELNVWDTEHNNGVLIYLLLAERAIEVVADRALVRLVPQAQWQSMVDRLGQRLHQGNVEDGLTEALEEVSALLVQHFPLPQGELRPNELPDIVVRV